MSHDLTPTWRAVARKVIIDRRSLKSRLVLSQQGTEFAIVSRLLVKCHALCYQGHYKFIMSLMLPVAVV